MTAIKPVLPVLEPPNNDDPPALILHRALWELDRGNTAAAGVYAQISTALYLSELVDPVRELVPIYDELRPSIEQLLDELRNRQAEIS